MRRSRCRPCSDWSNRRAPASGAAHSCSTTTRRADASPPSMAVRPRRPAPHRTCSCSPTASRCRGARASSAGDRPACPASCRCSAPSTRLRQAALGRAVRAGHRHRRRRLQGPSTSGALRQRALAAGFAAGCHARCSPRPAAARSRRATRWSTPPMVRRCASSPPTGLARCSNRRSARRSSSARSRSRCPARWSRVTSTLTSRARASRSAARSACISCASRRPPRAAFRCCSCWRYSTARTSPSVAPAIPRHGSCSRRRAA